MTDPVALASAAVALVSPALTEFGKAAVDKLGGSTVGGVLKWLGEKTSGPSRDALVRLEEKPTSPGHRAVLSEELADWLRDKPELLRELRDLLPKDAPAADRMQQTITGDNNKAVQIKGHGNTVTS